MFIPKKPDPVAARKELVGNCRSFAVAIIAIRLSTYVLDALQRAT